MTSYAIRAFDGADDDGGTLYVLYDEDGDMLTGASWPQPLVDLARTRGYGVTRLPSYEGGVMVDELMERVGDVLPACKIDGCVGRALATRGRYAGLCVIHKGEKVREQAEPEPAEPASEPREVTSRKPDEPSADPLDELGQRIAAAIRNVQERRDDLADAEVQLRSALEEVEQALEPAA